MDRETKDLIWATSGMIFGIFGAAMLVVASPFFALVVAGIAGYSIAVLVHDFIRYQWVLVEQQVEMFVNPDAKVV